jgi:hypothetical protein
MTFIASLMNIDIVCKTFGKDLYFAGKILLCKCIFFAAILSYCTYSQIKVIKGHGLLIKLYSLWISVSYGRDAKCF